MEQLFEKQNRLLTFTSLKIVRSLMDDIHWSAPLIAIRGARGVGKTTLMLQYIKQHYGLNSHEALYCDLGGLYFTSNNLLQLADTFYKSGGKHLFLDEVHKYPTWSIEIKEIYDSYPDMRVVFSGSSLLQLLNGDADLSRRCVSYTMQGFSFREFLLFDHEIGIPPYKLPDLLSNAADICAAVNSFCRPLHYFRQYLSHGYYPFYLRNNQDYALSLENVVDYIIEIELPQQCGVAVENVRKIKALLAVIASSQPFEVDITRLSRESGLQRNTVVNYLHHLHNARLLNLMYSDLINIKRMQKPDKIYLDNTNLLHVLSLGEVLVGTERETFVANQLSYRHKVEYPVRQGDFNVEGKYRFEVGGNRKKFSQIADIPDSYILADDIEMPIGNKLPIWLIGFLY